MTGLDCEFVQSCLEVPRGAAVEIADICIPVPRLRLKGNPAQKAEELGKQVNISP
jgi:hypothetical protein